MNFLNHIWKNYKTSITWIISAITVFSLWREYIAQDTAELVTQVVAIIWVSANVLMKKQ
jgi:hypothetical protein